MPVRFTCRLIALPTQSGKLRVQYGALADVMTYGGRLFQFSEARSFIYPPDDEMSEDEFELWQHRVMSETGASFRDFNIYVTDTLVEAKRTIEDIIPPGSIRANLRWGKPPAEEPTLIVEVTNEWNRPIPGFLLSNEVHYNQPQPMNTAGGIGFQAISASETMYTPLDPLMNNDLFPRRLTRFALQLPYLAALKSRVASLSHEHYWIALRTDGYAFDRINGQVVGRIIDQEK